MPSIYNSITTVICCRTLMQIKTHLDLSNVREKTQEGWPNGNPAAGQRSHHKSKLYRLSWKTYIFRTFMPRNRGRRKAIEILGAWEFLCSSVRQGWAESNLLQLVRLYRTWLITSHADSPTPASLSTGFCSERASRKNLQRFFKKPPLSPLPQSKCFWFMGKRAKTVKCFTLSKGKAYLHSSSQEQALPMTIQLWSSSRF